jgi:toxin CcdB
VRLVQFDVVRNSAPSRRFAPYIVILQSHWLEPLQTVVVAPLVNDASRVLGHPDIPVDFEGETFVLAVSELAAVQRRLLRERVGSLYDLEDQIRRALDRLFTGF